MSPSYLNDLRARLATWERFHANATQPDVRDSAARIVQDYRDIIADEEARCAAELKEAA